MTTPPDETPRRGKDRLLDRPVKKEYEPPRLELAGTLEEVTRGGGAPVSSDPPGSSVL